MPQDNLGPLVVQEIGVQRISRSSSSASRHRSTALSSFIMQPGARLCLVDDLVSELVDVDHIDPVKQFRAAEQQQPLPQVGGQVLVERGEQHVFAGGAGGSRSTSRFTR